MNAIARLFLRLAAIGFRIFCWLFRPKVVGAAVLVWQDGSLLLVQPSYRRWLTVPGGHVSRREEPRAAAARELQEEVGVRVPADALVNLGVFVVNHSYNEDHVHVYACEMPSDQTVAVDQREILSARFARPDTLAGQELWPPLRELLRRGLVRAV